MRPYKLEGLPPWILRSLEQSDILEPKCFSAGKVDALSNSASIFT